ncbi:MAG: hypothetical protein R3D33_08345 [Hyphomicrobiaceae bacterium]
MRDQIIEAADNLDRQLVRLALDLAGDIEGARQLLKSVASPERGDLAETYLSEAGAILRARRHLNAALAADEPEGTSVDGGSVSLTA